MGAAACDAAARYCLEVVHRPPRPADAARETGAEAGGAAAAAAVAGAVAGAAPLHILDPFCGEGSVLAAANALGVDAVGVDSSRKRCRHAASYVRDGAELAAGGAAPAEAESV
eukprot:scaffold28872_cov55-Phaeocystis_antarctica.AAC.7